MGRKRKDESLSLMDECITDAKALMAISLFNAQEELKERFTPQLKSLIAKRLQQEEQEEDDDFDDEDMNIEDDIDSDEDDYQSDENDAVDDLEDAEMDIDIDDDEDIEDDDFEDDEDIDIEDDEDDEEINLEAIMKQMEAITEEDDDEDIDIEDDEDIDFEDDEDIDFEDDEDIDIEDDEDDEDIEENIFTSFDSLDEDDFEDDEDIDIDDEDDEVEEQLKRDNLKLRTELKKYKAGTKIFKNKIAEQKFVQAKLLYVNDMLKRKKLSEVQKYKIVEAFDKAKNISDIKLIYKTLFEAYKEKQKREKDITAKNLREGVASKAMLVDKKKKIIENKDSNPMKDRYQVLANIRK